MAGVARACLLYTSEPTRYNLMRRALDEALTMSSSWTELSAVLRKKGYVFVLSLIHI